MTHRTGFAIGFIALLIGVLSQSLQDAYVANAVSVYVLKLEMQRNTPFLSDSSFPSTSWAWLSYRVQAPPSAVRSLERFLSWKPHHLIAGLRLGEVLWAKGRQGEAILAWRDVPGVDVYFANQAASAVKGGDSSRAQEMAEIAQAVDPKVKGVERLMYTQLCLLWRMEEQPERALPWCRLAAQTRGNGWEQLELAIVQLQLGDYENALVSVRWALELNRLEVVGPAYENLGNIYSAMGQRDKAIAAYQTALDMGYSSKWVHTGLAIAFLGTADAESSCFHFNEARKRGYVPSQEDWLTFSVCLPDSHSDLQ